MTHSDPSEQGEVQTSQTPDQSTDQSVAQEEQAVGQKDQATHKFVVRLPMPLRNRIDQAAKYYRRSMNSEIVARLEQSLQGIPSQAAADQIAPLMHDAIHNVFATGLNDAEERLVRAYRRMPPEKQQSLLELLS